MTRFPIRRPLLWAAVLTLGAAAALSSTRAAALCVGDCDGDGVVTIAEAQACVNLANNLPAPVCAAADQNHDGHVDANEVDACIQGFLDSTTCPQVTPAATSTIPANTPVPTNTHPANTNTPVPTNTRTPVATSTNTPVPSSTSTRTPASTNTANPVPTATLTATRTLTPAPPTPTATTAPVCPITAGQYTTTQVNSPSICTGGANANKPCTSDADCPGPQPGYTPFCGGSLKVYTFAPFPFPAGGTIVQDVGPGDANCVHNTVVPFPGGFGAPNFCVPALGYTVSVTQSGCGVGRIDSNGGSDFTVEETNDTSDTMNSNCTANGVPKACCTGAGKGTCKGVCGLPQGATAGCMAGADGSSRVDIKVGDGTPDTCASGTANAIVTVPVNTKTWQDNSPGTFGGCGGDGTFNAGDTVITQFSQILDFTTDTAHSSWKDIDGDGCSLAGGGPAAGQAAITGSCMDLVHNMVTTAAAGGFGSTGTPNDGSFSTKLTSTITQTGPFAGATCASPPAINFTGTATRCIH